MAIRITCLRLGGAAGAPPLHIVPGFGGQALIFAVLARHLAPVCSLNSFQVETDGRPDETGEPDVLQRYLDALRASGAGPYRLAGYCAGAYIACAVASSLDASERAGRVLAIVRSGDEGVARHEAETLADLATDGGRQRLLRADRTVLNALRLPDGLELQHALRIAEVMAAQSAAMDFRRHVPFPVPVRLVIGAPDRGSALEVQEHWRSILREEPEVQPLLGPLSDEWLRRPGVDELSAVFVDELRSAHQTP